MKATGMIRRIDDLGRVVIPRELRKTLDIKEGDPFEIYTIDGGVAFKKYQTDIDKLIQTYDLLNTVLYKKGIITALYYDGHKVGGHPSLPECENQVFVLDCGFRYTCNIALGHNHSELTVEENAMLRMAALTIGQKVMEIWDE